MSVSLALGPDPGVSDLLAFGQAVNGAGGGEKAQAEEYNRGSCRDCDELCHQRNCAVERGSEQAANPWSARDILGHQTGPHPKRNAPRPDRAPDECVHCRADDWGEIDWSVGLKQTARESGKRGGIGNAEGGEEAAKPEGSFLPLRGASHAVGFFSFGHGRFSLAIAHSRKLNAYLCDLPLNEGHASGSLDAKPRISLVGLKQATLAGQYLFQSFSFGHAAQLRTACGAVQ